MCQSCPSPPRPCVPWGRHLACHSLTAFRPTFACRPRYLPRPQVPRPRPHPPSPPASLGRCVTMHAPCLGSFHSLCAHCLRVLVLSLVPGAALAHLALSVSLLHRIALRLVVQALGAGETTPTPPSRTPPPPAELTHSLRRRTRSQGPPELASEVALLHQRRRSAKRAKTSKCISAWHRPLCTTCHVVGRVRP